MNKKPLLLAFGPVAAALAIGGGGGTSAPAYGGGSSAPPKSAAPSGAAGKSISLAHSKLGRFLVDGTGRTLYLFAADKTSASTCYSACASAWPPLTSKAAVKATPPLLASALGTTKRTDGTSEVTYRGHPLYYYVADAKAGDVTGQALNQFGAKWYVVSRSGNEITGNGR
jgi:predicted lipoprotein with Yx(FWY)xxD motif